MFVQWYRGPKKGEKARHLPDAAFSLLRLAADLAP
jgi:hypothetical protein